ncbi:MAG: hypothetical protein C0483_00895 [Pirellula sp.]|nr:hypothetical protein [Pirellula sp.]
MSMQLAAAKDSVGETVEVITLRIGRHRLGVDIGRVTEISTRLRPFPAPVAIEHIAGVLNLRGEVVTVLKLDVLLGASRNNASHRRVADAGKTKYVLLRSGDDRAAVEVDEVEDVQEIFRSDVLPLPDNVGRRIAALCDGVLPQATGMLLMLDVARLFALEDGAKARK